MGQFEAQILSLSEMSNPVSIVPDIKRTSWTLVIVISHGTMRGSGRFIV